MANKDHLALLKKGVDVWNQWRNERKGIVPDLSGANLERANLHGANFRRTDLSGANLFGANLSGANLSEAKLSGANFSKAKLRGADLYFAQLSGADLSGVSFIGADLEGARLSGVSLSGANFFLAKLKNVNLSEADLSGANLFGAKLRGTDVSGAELSGANLFWAKISRAHLSGEDFKSASAPPATTPLEDTGWTKKNVDDRTMIGAVNFTDTVQFTAYYPRDAKVNTRYSFLLYAHTEEAFEKVADDVEKFSDELGNKVPPPKTAKQTSQIKLDTPITIVPESEQIEFDPPSLTKKWGGEWTRFGFDFKPTQAMSGDTFLIRVSVQVATVEVIEDKAGSTQHITEDENPLAEANLNSNTSSLYQTIFISYSRKDKNVVKVYKLVQEAVGNVAFMDTDSIRAGEDWRSALAHAIDQADIFQLFWSDNSADSPNVRDEWEYALIHKCPETRCVGFIRPVCWNDPIKPSPPEELGRLNFKYVPLDNLVTS